MIDSAPMDKTIFVNPIYGNFSAAAFHVQIDLFHLRVRPSMNPRPALPTNGKPISTGKKGRLLWIILGIVLCPVPVPTPVEFRLFVIVDRIG